MGEKEKDIKDEVNQLPVGQEGETGGEAAPVEGEKTPAAPTARQKALERLRKRKEGRDFADDDDEAVFGAINEDADEDNAELEGYRADAQKWNDFLGSDWRAASMMDSWQENGSPIYAMVEEFGEDIMADLTNPDNKEKIKQSETKRLERLAKEKELNEEYENNVKQSEQLINSLKENGTYTEEQIDEAVETLKTGFMNFLVGKIDEDMIARAIKANNYDDDTANAAAQGEVKGRNTAISKELNNRKTATDGIPALGGGSSKQEKPERETQRYGRRPSMWG